MPDRRTITFNLDHVFEILRNGVRRADVFMGVGLNAAEHDPPISHLLAVDGAHSIRLVKEELTDEEKAHVAAEFGKWVRTNGLRELIETFSIFLHRLYVPLFVIGRGRGLDNIKLCSPARFEQAGITEQVEEFAKVVPVDDGNRRILRSLNQTRNCFAHRRGIVGARDLDTETKTFSIYWNALRLQIAEPDGNIVPEESIYGRVFENGGIVQARMTEQSKTFHLQQELMLEKRELKEICLSVLIIGQRFLQGGVSVAQEAGILKEAVDENLNDPRPV